MAALGGCCDPFVLPVCSTAVRVRHLRRLSDADGFQSRSSHWEFARSRPEFDEPFPDPVAEFANGRSAGSVSWSHVFSRRCSRSSDEPGRRNEGYSRAMGSRRSGHRSACRYSQVARWRGSRPAAVAAGERHLPPSEVVDGLRVTRWCAFRYGEFDIHLRNRRNASSLGVLSVSLNACWFVPSS